MPFASMNSETPPKTLSEKCTQPETHGKGLKFIFFQRDSQLLLKKVTQLRDDLQEQLPLMCYTRTGNCS